MTERWSAVRSAPEYEVSDYGTVRRVAGGRGATPGKVLQWRYGSDGYPRVHLRSGGLSQQWLVHRLVAVTFLGDPPDPAMDAAHINGVRNDPRLENLRWSTRTENNRDKVRHGTQRHGEAIPLAKLKAADIAAIKSDPRSQAEIAAAYGINKSQISRIRAGKAWVQEQESAL